MKWLVLIPVVVAVWLLLFMRSGKKKTPILSAGIVSALPCPGEIDGLVLHELYGKVASYNYLSVWLSRNYEDSHWRPILESSQAEIVRLRHWSETLEDPCVRRAYGRWLDYYDRELASAWKELRTKANKIVMDQFDARREAESGARDAYRREHSLPAPPWN